MSIRQIVQTGISLAMMVGDVAAPRIMPVFLQLLSQGEDDIVRCVACLQKRGRLE